MQESSTIVTIKATGERCRMFKCIKWQKVYYSLDHCQTWHTTKTAAYRAALSNGLLAVIDKPVTMLDGSVLVAR